MSIKFIDSLDLKGDMISASSSTTQISISKNNHGNINFQGFAAQLAGAENTKQQGITWQINNYNGDTDYGVQAAIAVSNNGAVGTQMGFFTSNSYGGGPTERIRISADGSVGIGTSNMYSRLNVRATSHSNGISVHRAADTTAAIYIGNDGGNNPILAANNADMLFGRDFSGVFTERMRLTNSGNLGVGTSNPTYKLHVNGTSYINETLYVNGATTVDANLTVTGLLRADSELQFLRGAGSGDYSNYIRAQNYPSAGYTGATSKYWLEYGAKGGHHFVLNTDGGAGSGENEYDDFTIWNGVVDGDRLFEVTNGGNVNITGAITASGYNDSNWNTAYGWGNHASAGYLTSINRPMVHAAIYGIGGDANDYTEFGIYRNYAENGPVTSHNTILNVMQTSGTYGFQLGSNTTPDTDGLYFRAKGADLGAGDWIQIASRDWVASQGYITSETDSQTLSWNGSNGQLTISSGNTVDLDGRYEDAGAADAVNIRIDEEILPAIDAKVSKAGDQVTGTLSVGGSAAYDSTNLALDVQGHMGIWGDHKLYFKITSDNYNTWSTSQYANGSQHRFNAQSFSFTNEGYSSSVFMNINSSGVGMSRNLVLGNEVYGDTNAYSNWGARLFFNGSNTDAQNNYYIGTNGEDYGGNYSKLDLRWHTGIRMGAQAGYGGIRFYDNEDLNTRIMSIGESDNNIRIDNNLWIGGAGGWITDLLAAKLSLSGGTVTGTITATGGINMGNTNITNVNHITINDAGYGEGIQWSNWMIYDSPDNLSNASGNFQISNAADSSIRVTVDTSGNLYPSRDRLHTLGKDTNRWQIVFCEILDSAGQHEKNLQNPEGEKSVGEYETGTVLVWKGGKNVPCTEPADHMRMGIAVKGIDSPLIQGAEPVLVTGSVNEGDYLVTSSVEGHAKAITPQFMRQHGLYDCVLGKALESAEGKSHLVKTWINI